MFAPLPTCPASFNPQPRTVPSDKRARLWELPAEIATTLVKLRTVTFVLRLVVVLSPSCPLTLYPQLLTVLLDKRARLWYSPAAIAMTPLVRLVTATRFDRQFRVPSP